MDSTDLVERVQASYDRDRWRRPNGRFITGQTRRGLTFMGPSVRNDAWMAYWLGATMPELARATWSLVAERYLSINQGGGLVVHGNAEQRIDIGNYNLRRGGAATYAIVAKAAKEFGATNISEAVEMTVHERYPLIYQRDAARHKGMSNLADLMHALARFGGQNTMQHLITGTIPHRWRTGPILAHAMYPDVLVARADTDGKALELVLYPGNGSRRSTLGIERLTPGTAYAVSGGTSPTINADRAGTAKAETDLRGRTEVLIQPCQSPIQQP